MKTQNDILTDIYKIVKSSPIDALNGGVYKKIRPTNSKLEDCVIHLINGNNAKFLQDAALYVKIFYNDIQDDNTYYEDAKRGGELEQMLYDLSTTLYNANGYSFELQSRETYTEAVEGDKSKIHQHYAILKINFLITINT